MKPTTLSDTGTTHSPDAEADKSPRCSVPLQHETGENWHRPLRRAKKEVSFGSELSTIMAET